MTMARRVLMVGALMTMALVGLAVPAFAATEKTLTVRMTGYSYYDNSPPGSADICCPVLHKKAGGKGTYDDPITVAVPGRGGRGMEFPRGTRFYAPTLKRYLVVEDSGASKASRPHLDVWVDGKGFPRRSSDRCMSQITGTVRVIRDPRPGHPVTVGPLTGPNGCRI